MPLDHREQAKKAVVTGLKPKQYRWSKQCKT